MGATHVQISRQFCGPPLSANGGYACGCVARGLTAGPGEGVRVDLRAPPPLDTDMRFDAQQGEHALFEAETLVARASVQALALDLPPAPSLASAGEASKHYIGFAQHPYPRCFVCGTQRSAGDGLRIFPGRAEADGPVSAVWEQHEAFTDAEGKVASEVMWAALDCPGYFGVAAGSELALLARMNGHIARRPSDGAPVIAMGWGIAREGRKLHAGTALFDEAGEALAWSRQLWITVDKVPGASGRFES